MEPTEAMYERARELWRLTAALTENPEDWPNEWQPIAQALATERAVGANEGIEAAAFLVQCRGGNELAERIRSLKDKP